MENAADALKMAGAVLLFVLALSVIIFSFGQARENSDIILNYKDRETTYIDGKDYYTTTGTEREVNIETIIGYLGEIPGEKMEGAHLHFEITHNGEIVEPLELMGK